MPLLLLFGDDRREFARWGPRPRALQELEAAASPSDAAAREAARRAFYRANRGRDLARELRARLQPRLGS